MNIKLPPPRLRGACGLDIPGLSSDGNRILMVVPFCVNSDASRSKKSCLTSNRSSLLENEIG